MSIDIYNLPKKTITVLCHTSLGDQSDKYGRFFVEGNEYKLSTEISRVRVDTNFQECILCWISFNDDYGSRFAVKGNIYNYGEPYWDHFTDYFVCPIQRERDNKLVEILNTNKLQIK